MKILSIGNVPLDPFLGSGKKRLAWYEGLRKLGHTVDVREPKDYEWGFGKVNRAKKFRQAWGAYRFFKKHSIDSYDLIEFCGDEFWLAIQFLREKRNRPFLVASTDGLELLAHERSLEYESYSGIKGSIRKHFDHHIHHKLSRFAFTGVDAFVSVAALDREYVIEKGYFPREKTEVIHNCLDPEFYREFPDSKEDRICFTGSWINRKGVSIAARVMRRLMESHPEIHFDVFGAGESGKLVLPSFPENLHTRIHVYGRLSNQDLSDALSKSKVFFFPTQYEGFGIATAEAMACGCAVVTTPTGLGWELKDGENACLTDFSDESKMHDLLDRLLDDDSLRTGIARKGWELAQSFRWEKNIARLEKTYLKWIGDWKR